MPWVKLDTDFWDHPKVIEAGERLAVKHQRAMCWCAKHSTNGIISNSVRGVLGLRSSEIRTLISLRLWDEIDANTWRIHDWEIYNPDAEKAKSDRDSWESKRLEMREQARERKRKQRAKEANEKASGELDVTQNVTVTSQPSHEGPTRVARENVSSRLVPSLDEDEDRDAVDPDPSPVAQDQPLGRNGSDRGLAASRDHLASIRDHLQAAKPA